MARDKYHFMVKQALTDDGWLITDDPYYLSKLDPKWAIDLGAEKVIAATKDNRKIAVEIKTFASESFSFDFHVAVGQYVNYLYGLIEIEPDRILYLAVPAQVWHTDFQRSAIQNSIDKGNIRIVVYNIEKGIIEKWID